MRYLKALLLEIRHNLRRVTTVRTTGDEDADFTAEQKFFAAIQPDAEQMLKQLQKFLLVPFLRGVATVPPTPPSSLVLDRHPHYARFAKIARLLNGGLSLGGEFKTIRWRNTAQWARNTLREEGLIRDDTPRGIWAISDAGRKWLEAQTGSK